MPFPATARGYLTPHLHPPASTSAAPGPRAVGGTQQGMEEQQGEERREGRTGRGEGESPGC